MEKIVRKRIGLFGGTFDPVHAGHVQMAKAAYEQADLDFVIFLPCQTSPHKLGKKSAPAADRLKMLELTLANESWAVINEYDLKNPPPNYSYLTIQAMAREYPQADFFWIMGYDQWQALPTWKNPELIASMVTFLVFTRGDVPCPREGYEMLLLTGTHPASATQIREHFLEHVSWMHPAAWEYAESKNLYSEAS